MAATLPITANIGYSSQKTDICVILHQFRLNSPWKVGMELSWRTHSRINTQPRKVFTSTRHTHTMSLIGCIKQRVLVRVE